MKRYLKYDIVSCIRQVLKAYKKSLFLNPENKNAEKIIKKYNK